MWQLKEDQIKRLNEISKLSKDQQQIELQEFLSTLSKDQIEFLKSQQKQQCLFCSIVEWKAPHYRIYEDDFFIGILNINPSSRGHVLILPKKHYNFITEVEEDFSMPIKKIAKKIYEEFNADASIIIQNGSNAGQRINHASIHIIPRYEGDEINLELPHNKSEEKELKEISQKLMIKMEIPKVEEKIEELEDYYKGERVP